MVKFSDRLKLSGCFQLGRTALVSLLFVMLWSMEISTSEETTTTVPTTYSNHVTHFSNITVQVQKFRNFSTSSNLQFRITWLDLNDVGGLNGYSIEIIPISTSLYCKGQAVEIHDKKVKSIEYPSSPSGDHNGFKVVRSCAYRIVVHGKEEHYVLFKVPDCLYNKCGCSNLKLDAPKEFKVKQISSSALTITMTLPNLLLAKNISNLYFKILTYQLKSFYEHDWSLKSLIKQHSILNGSQILISFNIHLSHELQPKDTYFVRTFYDTIHKCVGNVSGAKIQAKSFPKPSPNEPDIWTQKIMPVFMSVGLLLVILLIAWIKCGKWFQKNVCRMKARQNSAQEESFMRYNAITTKLVNNDIYISNDEYEICKSRLKLGKIIGIGAFGEVFIAELTSEVSGEPPSNVAVKMLKEGASVEDMNEFKSEISMLKMIGKHPNVVTILGCCTVQQPYLMIMEYVPCGDLREHLKALRKEFENRSKCYSIRPPLSPRTPDTSSDCSYITPDGQPPNTFGLSANGTDYTLLASEPSTPGLNAPILEKVLDPKELQNFAIQIAKGMAYLEEKEIVHRDLAARNVLIDEYKTLKISDFGMSRTGVYTNTKRRKLPLRWMAIESIKENLYTTKSDVWSYGIVLWEIGTLGAFPYPTVANHELLPFLLTGNRLVCPDNCTEDLYKLMLCCWKYSPEARPSFNELVNHLEDVTRRNRAYVDFSCLNPSYIFPPTEEQPRQTATRLNFSTVEIVSPQ